MLNFRDDLFDFVLIRIISLTEELNIKFSFVQMEKAHDNPNQFWFTYIWI